MQFDPFAVLGLERSAAVSDDEVRAAWRRIAAATHPDRSDGGDPAGFAAAAAAYTMLRTRAGRGEVLADVPTRQDRRTSPVGRPGTFAVRIAVAAVLSVIAVLSVGWQPASVAIVTGVLTWLVRTGREDLGSR